MAVVYETPLFLGLGWGVACDGLWVTLYAFHITMNIRMEGCYDINERLSVTSGDLVQNHR